MCNSPTSGAIFTYAKFGRFIILGQIHEPNPAHWQGTKVSGSFGRLGPQKYAMPRTFLDYINERATIISDALASVSENQQAKIDETFRQNLDNYLESDAHRAMEADIRLAGKDAFSK